MTPSDWNRVKELFEAAVVLQPAERVTFLAENCDDNLREEVQRLLRNYEEAGIFLEQPAISVGQDLRTEERPDSRAQLATSPAGIEVQDHMAGRRVGAYRLVKQIGQGGMAAVFLAVRSDDEYQKEVAIKLLQPGFKTDELLRRFRNERQTLAGLDHPNIVKLLDGGSTEDGLPYLVMDYVEGTAIDEYCDSHSLSVNERLRLFCHVCAAVQYAHDKLVVHRDLKPSNILVTPQGVPKLLDFGIAKVLNPDLSGQALLLTQTGTRRMTPAYASPEQVLGAPVSTASDIYSLGVVLYELLTGHRPYRLKEISSAEMELAICEQEPETPSTAVDRVETETAPDGMITTKTPELVSRTREGAPEKLRRRLRGDLDTILLTMLQKEPRRRYLTAKELFDDIQRHLQHLPLRARRNTWTYRTSKFLRRRKTEVVAAAMVAIVLLGTIGFNVWEEHRVTERARAEPATQQLKGRHSVAVLGFKNVSGRPETAWLSTALSEMLTTELSAGGHLRMIPGEDVAQTRLSLSIPETDSFNTATLHRLYKNLGSDLVVTGSYVSTGEGSEQVRLDLRLQDAVVGDTLSAFAVTGSRTDLSELVARAGTSLREKVGVAAPTAGEASSVKASMPASSEAARLYAQALERQRIYDFLGARELSEKAVAADPNFALAHLTLSDAWASYGDNKRAQDEAKKAFDLSAGLSREQSLMVQARYHEALHQWDKAIEIRRTLFNFFPDNLDHGLQLVATETAAGKGADSLDTIASLRKLPAPDSNDPRIDLAESLAANVVSDYKRQAVAAEQAIQKAQAIGARVLVARARIVEARAYMELGQKDKVAPALSDAQKIFEAVGDRFHAARVLQQVGLAYFYQGRLEEAKKTYEQALAIQRELGNRSNQAKLLNGIAMVLDQQGDSDGALQNYLQALALCREIEDRAMTGTVLGNLAGIEFGQGNFQGAKAHLQESLVIARQVGEQSGIALQLENLGLVLIAEGNPRAAKPLYEEAVQISRKTGKNKDLTTILIDRGDLQVHLGELSAARGSYQDAQQISAAAGDQQAIAVAIRSLGRIQFEQGELAAARKSYEQAQQILQRIGATKFVLDVRIALAELQLEEGHAAEAEHEARLVVEEFRKAKDPDNQASAQALLARALFAQGKTEDARRIAADAVNIASKGGSRATQIAAASAEAEVRTVSEKASVAAKTLRQLVSDSRKAGLVPNEFQARFVLGEAEIRAGNLRAGRTQLAFLERDARGKGFLLIARKASVARRQLISD